MSQEQFQACAQRALHINRTLGIRCAAGFLRNKGVPVELAVSLLAVKRAAR